MQEKQLKLEKQRQDEKKVRKEKSLENFDKIQES